MCWLKFHVIDVMGVILNTSVESAVTLPVTSVQLPRNCLDHNVHSMRSLLDY